MSSTPEIRFLVNPSSSRGRASARLPSLRAVAARLGAGLEVSDSAADLRRRARRAVAEEVERLVVVGGDGSQHLAIQEVAGSECALVPVAGGRGNDLVTCLELESDLDDDALAEWIADAPIRQVDVGRAGEVFFGVHCGVGFDSEAARWANHQRWVKGNLSYPLAALRTLVVFSPPRIRVAYDGGLFDEEGMFVVCANCWRFGGGMKIAPEAAIDDGLLDVVLVRRVSKPAALRLLLSVYSGQHIEHPAVEIVRTPWARISLDRRMEMYGDGEAMLWAGRDLLEVQVLPGALKVLDSPSRRVDS